MPVEFLTDEQERRYGRYAGEPAAVQLARYFHLDATDLETVQQRRGDHNRLGFALQLCTVRFLGTFLENPLEVPEGVAAYLAGQLGIADPGCLTNYGERTTTIREHAGEIRGLLGYRDLAERGESLNLLRWMYERAWLATERPSVLFDLATARLVERKVLLPGVSTLARMVSRVRDRVAVRLWRTLARMPDASTRARLEGLLAVGDNRQSALDRLRRRPDRASAPALVKALERVEEVRKLGIAGLNFSVVPPNRLDALARVGATQRVNLIARMPPERKIATLLAFAQRLSAEAVDDALDIFERLAGALFSGAERSIQLERLRTLKDLDAEALKLCAACEVVLDGECDDHEVRAEVFERVGEEHLAMAVAKVVQLTRPPENNRGEWLSGRWGHLRRFWPKFVSTVEFAATDSGAKVLEAVLFLQQNDSRRGQHLDSAPLALVNKAWRRLVVVADSKVERKAYTFCILEKLLDALKRRDVFVPEAERWGDPHRKLLSGPVWEAAQPKVLRVLGRSGDASDELAALGNALDGAYRSTAANLPSNNAVRVATGAGGRDRLVLSGLDRLEEPVSLSRLKVGVQALLPVVELSEAVLEIHARTGFCDDFTHVGGGTQRADNLHVSVCAVLLAEACNIGLHALMQPDVPELTRDRLSHVQQNYLRAETITRANARLVEAQSRSSLAQRWGGGEVASADGLRFVVPVRTLSAGANPKYFGVGRGITYYNFTSDQFTGIHGLVVPGTLKDSMVLLAGLLEQQTSLSPTEIMTDTGGYTDIVFGLFWLLGYQFSPRLADVGDARFWRIDPEADYGPLDGLARQRINTGLICENWEDMLRVAGSLKLGTVSAVEVMRLLSGGSRSSTLAKAIAEVGRIAKTDYLLNYIDDEAYRRRILVQLNRGEGRHSLARAVFHGGRGQVRKRYREGQEDQLGALGLVVNCLALWNTRYMEAALKHLQDKGETVLEEDLARLSPLGYRHINLLGSYSFQLAAPLVAGQMRPLRDPKDYEAQTEEEGGPL